MNVSRHAPPISEPLSVMRNINIIVTLLSCFKKDCDAIKSKHGLHSEQMKTISLTPTCQPPPHCLLVPSQCVMGHIQRLEGTYLSSKWQWVSLSLAQLSPSLLSYIDFDFQIFLDFDSIWVIYILGGSKKIKSWNQIQLFVFSHSPSSTDSKNIKMS